MRWNHYLLSGKCTPRGAPLEKPEIPQMTDGRLTSIQIATNTDETAANTDEYVNTSDVIPATLQGQIADVIPISSHPAYKPAEGFGSLVSGLGFGGHDVLVDEEAANIPPLGTQTANTNQVQLIGSGISNQQQTVGQAQIMAVTAMTDTNIGTNANTSTPTNADIPDRKTDDDEQTAQTTPATPVTPPTQPLPQSTIQLVQPAQLANTNAELPTQLENEAEMPPQQTTQTTVQPGKNEMHVGLVDLAKSTLHTVLCLLPVLQNAAPANTHDYGETGNTKPETQLLATGTDGPVRGGPDWIGSAERRVTQLKVATAADALPAK
jgi:hypothetical protein